MLQKARQGTATVVYQRWELGPGKRQRERDGAGGSVGAGMPCHLLCLHKPKSTLHRACVHCRAVGNLDAASMACGITYLNNHFAQHFVGACCRIALFHRLPPARHKGIYISARQVACCGNCSHS